MPTTLQNQTRTTLEKKAVKLQRFWRKQESTAKLVEQYTAKGPSTRTARERTLKELDAMLRQPELVDATQRCLLRVHAKCRGPQATEELNTRVFLTAYFIVSHPNNLFRNDGALVQDLKEAAAPLIETFEAIVEVLRLRPFSEVPREHSGAFRGQLDRFLAAFKAWKVVDEADVTMRIETALRWLYNLWLGQSNPAVRPQVRRLRRMLVKIARPEALASFDARCPAPAGLLPTRPPSQ